ncbi:hypothetical protein SAMN06295885_1192 [Rathayibacter oskolensis]|uniref:Uncharacterized protein n=1 Tax=Rathayibacter oskolensis TaxID=1891671 RepID=A0A1X7NE71_9MICO|nr:hypothetical protein SAMN06295885_1192 [Rathayibacter oskolensis]
MTAATARTTLAIGRTAVATVEADRVWNDTGIDVEAGGSYRFVAEGRWLDLRSPGGPDGLDELTAIHRLLPWVRRRRDLPWFALLGATERRKRAAFLIGSDLTWLCAHGGPLLCFANDARLMYGNNSGSVALSITRIS